MMTRSGLSATFLILVALPGQTETQISSVSELAIALAQAAPGETLVLAPGEYGSLAISTATRHGALTLRSDDQLDPARFSGLDLRGVRGITLEGIAFDYRFLPGDALWAAPFAVANSQDVILRHCGFFGDLARDGPEEDNGYATGVGLTVDHAADVWIDGNSFLKFYRGLVVSDSDRVTVTGNDISGVRSDGMNFIADQTLLVADNFIHDFRTSVTSDDHADMIQFWTAGTTRPTRDVVIRDNVLNAGAGSWTQSILMGNEIVAQGQADAEMRYRNITVTGNVILNAHLHGISVGEADGVVIANNTLIHLRRADGADDNPTLWTPRINLAPTSDNVSIEGNATAAIAGTEGRPDWTVRNNVLIQDQDPAKANFYDTVFLSASSSTVGTLGPFTYLPGGPVDGIRVGAARLIAPPATGQLTALIRTVRDAIYLNRFIFDAGYSTGPDRLQAALYLWSFSDGSTAEGRKVAHDFNVFGLVRARLTVQTTAGARALDAVDLWIPSPELIHFDSVSGAVLAAGKTGLAAVPGIAKVQSPGENGWGLPIEGGLVVPQASVQRLSGARDFDLQLRLTQLSSADPGGEIVRVHPMIVLTWEENQGFGLRLQMAQGNETFLQTRTPQLDPGRWYDLAVHYDASMSIVTLSVDGKLAAKANTAGPPLTDQVGDFTLGNPFGQKSFKGLVSGIDLSVNQTAYAK